MGGSESKMVMVSAPTNIACIKYWGKADVKWNTPTNDSVSVTLDQDDLRAVTTAAASPLFEKDRLWLNGVEDENAFQNKRFRACVDGVKALSKEPKKWKDLHVHVSSYNTHLFSCPKGSHLYQGYGPTG